MLKIACKRELEPMSRMPGTLKGCIKTIHPKCNERMFVHGLLPVPSYPKEGS